MTLRLDSAQLCLMANVAHKHDSIQRLVADVYKRVPSRLVSVEDGAPDDPYVITFVRSSDGEELCTIKTEGNEPGRYDIIDAKMRVPRSLIQGVVCTIKDKLKQKRK
jgi:hypothetical protein